MNQHGRLPKADPQELSPELQARLAAWFEKAWKATGRKLDMGKACIRFRRLADLPLDVIAEAVGRMTEARFVASYEAGLPAAVRKKLASNAGFAWLKREVTPVQRQELHDLGIPGLGG